METTMYSKIFWPDGIKKEYSVTEMEHLVKEISDFSECHLKHKHYECYEHVMEIADGFVLGPHFNEERLKKALSELVHRDGSRGCFWTLEQTNDVATQGKFHFTEHFNQYDFCYAMNLSKARHGEFIQNNLGSDNVKYYFELAKSWKPSVMIPEGAIWHVYKAYTEARKES